MRIRTIQRAKVIGSGVTIIKTSTVAGMRQVRCIRCQGMAAPAKDHTGRDIYICTACGTKFVSRRI